MFTKDALWKSEVIIHKRMIKIYSLRTHKFSQRLGLKLKQAINFKQEIDKFLVERIMISFLKLFLRSTKGYECQRLTHSHKFAEFEQTPAKYLKKKKLKT